MHRSRWDEDGESLRVEPHSRRTRLGIASAIVVLIGVVMLFRTTPVAAHGMHNTPMTPAHQSASKKDAKANRIAALRRSRGCAPF